MPEKHLESPISKLNRLFSRLGADPEKNITMIVEAAADILLGVCALFNRLDQEDKSLCAWSTANAPENLPERDNPEGHICYEATIKGRDKPVVIPDIRETLYAVTDSNVARYGLRSYLGYPVRRSGRAIGALCVVDVKTRDFSEDEVNLISTLAKAISLEEERKQIAEQYATSQAMVEQMQRLAAIGGWEMDPETLEGTSTGELNRILDLLPTAQVPNADAFLAMCYSDEDKRTVAAAIRQMSTSPDPQPVEARIRTGAGRIKWFKAIGQTRFENGNPVRTFGSLQDITDYKEIQERLTEAKTAAERASMAKSRFLANMSHEVRTPLNGVLGMLQLVLRTDLTNEQREYLEVGLHSCRGLLTVINDLLDLAKIEAGKVTLSEEPLFLTDIISAACQGFSHQIMGQDVKLSYSVDSRTPNNLLGDAGRLSQILFNLVSNAVKFTPTGSIRLDVSPVFRQQDQTRILFTVQDTGVGIPDDALERAFEPFEQIDAPLKEKVRGTGLGLGIVRKLVEVMGGTLSVKSAPGAGTTVFVSLPFKMSPDEAPSANTQPGGSTGGMRILLVEDNPVNLTAPKLFLEKIGNVVDAAENGTIAMTAVRKNRYDVIFMDLEMPEMDGIETTRRIRETKGLATPNDTPIIALTAYAFAADRERCFKAGMDAFLPKPVDFKEIEQVLITIRKNAKR